MGTSNFCYRHRLDVIRLSSVHDWNDPDWLATENQYREREGAPLIAADDWDYFGTLANDQVDTVVGFIQRDAQEMDLYWSRLSNRDVSVYSYAVERDSRLARSHYDNNYGGLTIAVVEAEIPREGLCVKAQIELVLRSGYYDGANIDPILSVGTDVSYGLCEWEDGYDHTVDIRNDLYLRSDLSGAQADALYRVRKGCKHSTLDLDLDAVIRAAWIEYERLVSDFVEPYTEFARFSNGETWYCRKERV